MNHPTREEFEDLKAEVRKLKERQTEPIRITRLELDSGSIQDSIKDVNKKLDTIQEETNVVKIQIEGARSDIRTIKANQSDMRGYIEEQFKHVEAKQDTHTELLGKLINSAESHEALLKNTATKEDLSQLRTEMKSDMTAMESRLKNDMTAMESRLLSQFRTEMRSDMTAMESRIIGAVKQLLQQNSGE